VCGGYTSKNWDGSDKWTDDIDAFVFNMIQKYIPNDHQEAIHTRPNGFEFGNGILFLTSDSKLNDHNQGCCYTGNYRYYDIEGDESPLTNQEDRFTCAELEVYKVVY
jgi:hypothetical protein